MLRTGDIFATQGRGLAGWLSRNWLLPKTDRYHFGLLGQWIEPEQDWVTLESTVVGLFKSGPTVGRLSWRKGEDLKFYRPAEATEEDGMRAVVEATKYGSSYYDFLLIARLVLDSLRRFPPPVHVTELRYSVNSEYICTELVATAWAFKNLIPEGMAQIPAAFQLAVDTGRLLEIEGGPPGSGMGSYGVMPGGRNA